MASATASALTTRLSIAFQLLYQRTYLGNSEWFGHCNLDAPWNIVGSNKKHLKHFETTKSWMMLCHLRTNPQEPSNYTALLARWAYMVGVFHAWGGTYQQPIMLQHCYCMFALKPYFMLGSKIEVSKPPRNDPTNCWRHRNDLSVWRSVLVCPSKTKKWGKTLDPKCRKVDLYEKWPVPNWGN